MLNWFKNEMWMCRCGNYTTHRCACGEWWCHQCLSRHTSAPGGRCPTVVQREAAAKTAK